MQKRNAQDTRSCTVQAPHWCIDWRERVTQRTRTKMLIDRESSPGPVAWTSLSLKPVMGNSQPFSCNRLNNYNSCPSLPDAVQNAVNPTDPGDEFS